MKMKMNKVDEDKMNKIDEDDEQSDFVLNLIRLMLNVFGFF